MDIWRQLKALIIIAACIIITDLTTWEYFLPWGFLIKSVQNTSILVN